MSNALLSPTVYAKTALALLTNDVVAPKMVDTQFTDEFKSVGQTVKAKRHPEFSVRSGRVADVQDVLEGEVTIRLDTQEGVDIKFTTIEETLTVDSLLHSKAMKAATAALAQSIESRILNVGYKNFYHWAGTQGQTINSALDFFEGPAKLDDMAVPKDDRHAILYGREGWALAGSFTGGASTSQPASIVTPAIERAKIPMIGDIQPVKSNSVPLHVNGTWTGDALVKGASQSVSYSTASVRNSWSQPLLIDDLSNGATVKVGDVIEFTDVYEVNPRTKVSTGYKQRFVVRPSASGVSEYVADTRGDGTEDPESGTYTFSTGGSAEMTITISPPIITSGPYQTVNKAPDNDSAITVIGTGSGSSRMNLCFHRNAIALCMAKPIMPFSGEADIAVDADTGIAVRYWRYSNGTNDEHNHRLDVIYGVTGLDPRKGTRQSGLA